MRNVLMVSFQFPPFSGSSGLLRPLKFVKYLPEHGWRPLVLTVARHAYIETSEDQNAEVPSEAIVERAFAIDAGRHLAYRGRYFGLTALPDRWASWWLFGVIRGLSMIRRHRPEVIWATYPIASALLIAASLSRLSGLPYVADFRDAMVFDDFPEDPSQRRRFERIEPRIIASASAAVFTTPASRELYRLRYPEHPTSRLVCIRNGYDETDFAAMPATARRQNNLPLRLVHSGLLKLNERDPRPFLAGLARAIGAGGVRRGDVDVVFRAPGDENLHQRLVAEAGLDGVVRILPRIPYGEALQEMADADALLIFQDAGCNHLVPAKLYECIRAQRPILALTDHAGETADLLRESGSGAVMDIRSADEIATALPSYLAAVASGTAAVASEVTAARYSRRHQTAELADLLAAVAGSAVTAAA
ncbi:MAG: glycosyltransferase family 4 protein [Gammaproteobacteria bacterium]|nr:glycosyltransferase family 4 protein [Gammaproteobacteria bacterium]